MPALAALALLAVVLRPKGPTPRGTSVPPGSDSAASRNGGSLTPTARFARTNSRDEFVGSAACAPCHRAQADAYARSHHALALVKPAPDVVRATFAGKSFSTPLGGTTRFARRDERFEVVTPTPRERSATFAVAYVAGVLPLQQYVVATERGKLQTLGVSWDTRPAKAGGERWFHVYGPSGIARDDPLFFTEPAQNWNHVCADCHSTFVERRYDVAEDAFDTRWAELSVGCEACHGPGGQHVRAANDTAQRGIGAGGAPAVTLKPAAPWTPSSTGSPVVRPQDGVEVEVCAPCHSRREPLREGFLAGDPFLDGFEPELLRSGRYHGDGQVAGEVYEWGSFVQSKMFASGVRCSDCHDPHTATLRAEGDALCVHCHSAARFATESHTHHIPGKAPLCIDCHMPPATFMQVDERRDHSIRIPRPDLSVTFGTPNACTLCHTKESATWARERMSAWYPTSASRPHFSEALLRDEMSKLDARRALDALARDPSAPAIARATALERLGQAPTRSTIETLRAALSSPDPLVVFGAVRGASALSGAERASLLVPAAAHRVRAVRVAAGKALAAPPGDRDAKGRGAVELAFADVQASFAVSASRPETHVERSSFELARGNLAEAEAALRTALRLAPCLPEAHLNLAELARRRDDEVAAEREIRKALGCAPANAAAHHALGLWQVRAHGAKAAVASLRKAVELAPAETRFAYVLAVALADGGDFSSAVKVLEKRANEPQLLQALAIYLTKLGDEKRAAQIRNRLDRWLAE